MGSEERGSGAGEREGVERERGGGGRGTVEREID